MKHTAIVLSAMVLFGCYDPLADPPEASAREERVLSPEGEETAQCGPDVMAAFAPPAALLEHAEGGCDAFEEGYCFPLSAALRAVAAEPGTALPAAVEAFAVHRQTEDPDALARARALSDLAVTGEAAYARFEADAPTSGDLDGHPDDVSAALERAYDVAWALRGPAAHRTATRPSLGWVAVSGEDDPPGRPVNIAAGGHPQLDVWVDVPLENGETREVRTRLQVASTQRLAEAEVPSDLVGAVPPRTAFRLPDAGDVIVSLHGHSSLAEEAAPWVGALLETYAERGEDVTVLMMDLPSNGYASRVDPDEITSANRGPDAVLRFYEAFVEALLATLSADVASVFDRIDAVAGGSLGGNLVLRLAERRLPWVRRVVSWSPASIDYSWTRSELADLIKSEAVRQTRDESVRPGDEDSRRDFFVGGLTSLRNQAGYWYRDDWAPCAERFVAEGLLQIGETYDDRFRRWHFRVAHEQLVFSHLEDDPNTGAPRFEAIDVPVMLLAGEADDAVPMQTWTFARRLSPHLGEGRTLFLEDTGHAMHSERPRLLAREVADWLLE